MPVNQFPHRALPARFRRTRVLIIGCGDVGQRIARDLLRGPSTVRQHGPRVLALTSSAEKAPLLQQQGMTPLRGNLDDVRSLRRLRGIAQRVIYMAPPPNHGLHDVRMANVVRVLRQGKLPHRHGVWLDHRGVRRLREGRGSMKPGRCAQNQRAPTPRGCRAAFVALLEKRAAYACKYCVFPASMPRTGRVGTPAHAAAQRVAVLQAGDDVFTNHIHADELARIAQAALWRGKPQRVYHVSDDTNCAWGLLRPGCRPVRPAAATACDAAAGAAGAAAHDAEFHEGITPVAQYAHPAELRVPLRWPTVREGLGRR